MMRGRPRPLQPTPEQVADHEIDHFPFRSWCRACVAALSRADKHPRYGEDANAIPVIGLDYGFFKDSVEAKAKADGDERIDPSLTPILFFKDKKSKTVHGDVVSCKGPTDA